MKKFLISLFLFVTAFAHAQDYFIIDGPQTRTDATLSNQQCAVVFISKASDLVITTNKDERLLGEVNSQGDYEYKQVFTIAPGSNDRNFTISKQGTAYRTSFKKGLAAGKELRYSVAEVENYISLDPIGTLTDIYKNDKELSCIDFTISLKEELKVQFDPALPAQLRTGKAQSGADLYVLDIDAKAFKKLVQDATAKKEAFEKLNNALYVDCTTEATDENDAEWERLKKEMDTADSLLAAAQSIRISVKGSQMIIVPVDVATICRPTGKQSFAVTPKTEKEYIDRFFSQYGELIHQAESHKASRDYDLAQQFYDNASKATDASDSDKQVAERAAAKMGELAVFKKETDVLADKLYMLTITNQVVNKEAFFSLIDDIANRYETLGKETNDASYISEANRLRNEKNKVGIVFMGRVVMSEYTGGQLKEIPITNVRIYGSSVHDNDDMDKPSYKNKGELITTITAEDGRYNIRLKPGQYKTLIFEAVGNSKIKKNKHVSVEGLNKDRNVKIRFAKD